MSFVRAAMDIWVGHRYAGFGLEAEVGRAPTMQAERHRIAQTPQSRFVDAQLSRRLQQYFSQPIRLDNHNRVTGRRILQHRPGLVSLALTDCLVQGR